MGVIWGLYRGLRGYMGLYWGYTGVIWGLYWGYRGVKWGLNVGYIGVIKGAI